MFSKLVVVFAALFFASGALAQRAEVYSDRSGAIRGYDPVAYFTAGRPLRGSPQFTHHWRGAALQLQRGEI